MKIIILFFTAFLCSACGFNQINTSERIMLVLPQIDAEIQSKINFTLWKITYIDGSGTEHVILKDISQNAVELELPKNKLSPILAEPLITGNKSFFYPAGCIYPLNAEQVRNKKINATWHTGFSAFFVYYILLKSNLSFAQTQKSVSFFNWEKFIQETQKHKNPWILDQEKLFSAFVSQKISTYSFSALQQSHVAVQIPDSTWIKSPYMNESIINPANADSQFEFDAALTNNVHYFISEDFIVSVYKENGKIILNTKPH